jgi:hypothetical protein
MGGRAGAPYQALRKYVGANPTKMTAAVMTARPVKNWRSRRHVVAENVVAESPLASVSAAAVDDRLRMFMRRRLAEAGSARHP